MKIKTISDVTEYLDNFYYSVDFDRNQNRWTMDRNGKPFQQVALYADKTLFKHPEKVLSKMMVSHIKELIDQEYCIYRKENDNKNTQWTIEWRIRPEYLEVNDNRRCASVYARFSIYPRTALKEKE